MTLPEALMLLRWANEADVIDDAIHCVVADTSDRAFTAVLFALRADALAMFRNHGYMRRKQDIERALEMAS